MKLYWIDYQGVNFDVIVWEMKLGCRSVHTCSWPIIRWDGSPIRTFYERRATDLQLLEGILREMLHIKSLSSHIQFLKTYFKMHLYNTRTADQFNSRSFNNLFNVWKCHHMFIQGFCNLQVFPRIAILFFDLPNSFSRISIRSPD